MAGITNDGAVYITQRPSAGVPAGSPVIGGVSMTNDGAAYVTGNVGGPYALPTMVGIGDSRVERGNAIVAATISRTGTTATVSATSHNLWSGAAISISLASKDEYNGPWTILSRVDANSFTITVPETYAASATGATVMSQSRFTMCNYYALACALAGGRVRYIWNAGVGGDTTEDVLARLQRDALAFSPDIVAIEVGVNDAQTDAPFATTIANLTEIYSRCLNSGAMVLASTPMPLGPSHPNYTVARAMNLANIRQWIIDFCRKERRMICDDGWGVIIDPTSATGAWRTDATDSTSTADIHQSEFGTQLRAAAIKPLLEAVFPPVPLRAVSMFDNYGVDATSDQLIDNGLMQGTGGATSGTVTGSVPDGWTLTETGAGNVTTTTGVSRADGIGSDFQMVCVGVNNNDTIALTRTTALVSRVSAGDVLEAEMDVTGTSLSGLAHVEFGMALSVSGGSGLQISAMSNHGTSTAWTQDFSGVFRSPKFTVPASPTNLNVRCLVVFAGAGGATLKVGRVSVRKVNNAFT